MNDETEPERPTFGEWLEANNIRQNLTEGQWDDMIARDEHDLHARFLNFSVSGIIPNSPWQYRHDLWKQYGRDTGARVFEAESRFILTWPEAMRMG
jgi:hypothetical protein